MIAGELHTDRMPPRTPAAARLALLVALTAAALGTAAPVRGGDGPIIGAVAASPAQGLSWLNRRGLDFERSCFGRVGRMDHSPVGLPTGEPPGPGSSTFTIRGQDLYRYSCQSCHLPSGRGCGEEIKSLGGPVRSTTVAAIRQGMEARGLSLPLEMLESLAAQNEATLRQRLAEGGEKMPYFEHLESAEVQTLIDYLRILSGLPDAEPPGALRVSRFRVGELIVKGTCQTCHNANGARFYDDVNRRHGIPSLASIGQLSPGEVLNKVRGGAIRAGERRGRMPIFSYLTEEEVRAAYIYLVAFPPRSGVVAERDPAIPEPEPAPGRGAGTAMFTREEQER